MLDASKSDRLAVSSQFTEACTNLSTLHQSYNRSLVDESPILLDSLQDLCSLDFLFSSSRHIEVDPNLLRLEV
jgi:hypothetical protein